MRYKCECPEWEDHPCDNPNEEIECCDCQYSRENEEE